MEKGKMPQDEVKNGDFKASTGSFILFAVLGVLL